MDFLTGDEKGKSTHNLAEWKQRCKPAPHKYAFPEASPGKYDQLVGAFAAVLALVVVSLDILRQGGVIQFIVPIGCVIFAIMLIRKRPAAYTRFVLWCWCLAPFLRRVVDYRCGFTDQSLILAAPVLVTSISLYGLWPKQNISATVRQLLPFFVCLGAVFYGAATTVMLQPSIKFLYVALDYTAPIIFGLYLCAFPDRFEVHRRVVQSTFLHVLLVLGTYGLVQYIVMPGWDVFWLTNVMDVSGANTFGRAEPGMLRVWSTVNAPGPFAFVLLAGLILLNTKASRWKIPALILAVVNLGLTLIRTAWIGLGIALFLLVLSANLKSLSKYLLIALLLLGSLPILSVIPGVSYVFHDRLQTFNDPTGDVSYQDRREVYQDFLSEVLGNPLGTGAMSQPPIDSGIFEMLLSLGWPGTFAYLFAVGVVLGNPYAFRRCKDPFVKGCQAVALSFLFMLLSGNMLLGLPGIILWMCIALYRSGTLSGATFKLTPLREGFPA